MFTALFGEEYYDALVKGDEGQGQTIEFQDMFINHLDQDGCS